MPDKPSDPGAADLSRRVRNKQRTRRALEDAALELFAERGYDRTTIEDIAERADVSPRTFFRYFTAKEGVVLDQWTEQPATFRAAVAARPAGEPLLVALREGFAQFAGREQDGARQRMFLRNRVIGATPLLRGLGMARIGVAWREAVASAIAGRLGADEPTPEHEVLADVVMAVIARATADWVDGGGVEPLEDLGRREFDRCASALRLLTAGS
ncbi:MAG: TetR family transcriptional regulator [Streptomycetaceae bacterium]|nr:TetR family transcriptional regulator [Streptomycetaceae bacterium]